MAYDPADLRLPRWLLGFLDALIRLRLPLGFNLHIGMTRPGVLLTAALLGIWGAAFYSANNLLYLCGAMLTSLAVAAVVRGRTLLRRLPTLADFPLPLLEAGEASVLRESLPHGDEAVGIVDVSLQCPPLHPELQLRVEPQRVTLQGWLHPERRGVFSIGRECVSTAAPLGLYSLSLTRGSTVQLVCMPAAVVWSDAGRFARQLQEGDEWRDLRAYASGDPLGRIHWRKATLEPKDWAVKRFARHEADEADETLSIDLRLPEGVPETAFERLLGKAWFWLQSRQSGHMIIGRRSFDVADPAARAQAMLALAEASPETLPPVFSGGLRLSLVEGDG